MHPEIEPPRRGIRSGSPHKVGGFSILIALFIIVVLGALALLVVEITGAGQTTPILALREASALAAAESGIQWDAHEALTQHACPPTTTISLTPPGLSGFSVTVTCSSTPHTESGTSFNVYAIQADASNGPFGSTPDFVQRKIEFTATDAPS
jgi:MSHA biogenesis protein MshP